MCLVSKETLRLSCSEDSSVSLRVSELWKCLNSGAAPTGTPRAGSQREESFHLDHIMVFADAECRRVGLLREGPAFLSPTPPLLLSVLSLLSSGLLPTSSDKESESHPRRPIPRPAPLQPRTSSLSSFSCDDPTNLLSVAFPKRYTSHLICLGFFFFSSSCHWDDIPSSWASLPPAS